ncbi:zinc-dependent metalloprotease [Gelidibacter sp. F2691]|nr:zinc-dependent metalloprotease [Gelidibacter sp. F2691]
MKGTNNNTYCLKVYFHVIRRTNGTGGQTLSNVNEAFSILNQDFNPHNISFNWDNQIDYIDNDSYYGTPSTAIFNVNNHQDGIDIYLFDDSSSSGGRANGVGDSSEFWVSGSYWKSPYNSLTKSNVISHEMGHVLYLWHTHHGTYNEGGSDTSQCPELVNGSNSASCGDYVKDTPADPHLEFNVNPTTCQWDGSGTDSNGEPYNPDEKNLMSYTDVNCMEYFSQGQGQRMRNAISTLPYLQQTITSNCSVTGVITGDRLICYDSNNTYNITDIESDFIWQVSPNLQIVSSNTTSITVTPTSNNTRENGYIRAVLENQTVEKNIWIGKPSIYTFNSNGTKKYFGESYSYPVSHSTREIKVYTDSPDSSFSWDVFPNNLTWTSHGGVITFYINTKGNYVITAKATNECGEFIQFYTLNVGESDTEHDFKISPNPASDSFTISKTESNTSNKLDLNNSNYVLYDMNFNMKIKSEFKNYNYVNVSHLNKGLYILKIVTDKKVEHHRIIIK